MSSYKLNSSFEIVGSFWEKGNEQGRMNGTLICDKGRLRFQSSPDFKTLTDQQLRETFLNDKGERKTIDAVRGYTREDICTLFYLMELSDDGVINFDEKYSITALKWNVNAAVMGLHLDSAEANCLDRAAFTFTKIYKWLPSNLHFAISDEGLTFVSPSKPCPQRCSQVISSVKQIILAPFVCTATIHSQSVCTALHVFTALKLPSVALYVVEFTFQRGFDSFRAHQFIQQLTTKSPHGRTSLNTRKYSAFRRFNVIPMAYQ